MCLEDLDKCHYDGSLGYCCSGFCIQNDGEPFGYCQLRQSTTTPSFNHTYPTNITTPSNCLAENSQCKPDGSLGVCCSYHCSKLEAQEFGRCVGSTPPDPTDFPEKCLENGADCKVDGTLGFCCSRFCNIIAPHTIGTCEGDSLDDVGATEVSWIIYTSVALTLAVIVAIVLTGFYWLHKRQRKLESKLSYKEAARFFSGDPNALTLTENSYAHEKIDNIPYDQAFEIYEADFVIDWDNPLGEGCFGVVLKGTIKHGGVAAVKTLRQCDNDRNGCGNHLRALLSEIKILQYIGKHENIVNMVGCNTAKLKNDGTVFLFLEYCELGSLESFMKTHKSRFLQMYCGQSEPLDTYLNIAEIGDSGKPEHEISLDDLLTWTLQITNALIYLEEKKVIHADIATRNVLLQRQDVAKLTDFGLSRRLYNYDQYIKRNQEPLPWRWMALESLKGLTFSHKSDVWSLGITFWEIYSLGNLPYAGYIWSPEFVTSLENGFRPEKPPFASDIVYDIMINCWNPIPSARPSFRDIYAQLSIN